MKRLDLCVCPANLSISLATGKLADDSLTWICSTCRACPPPPWSLLFMLPALFLWWFSEIVTLNVPLQAGVFNVECSVGMHTADLEMYHPTLWHSSQTFYTGGEPGKQVNNTRTSVMLFLFFWSNEDKWSWGTWLGHSNKGSKFAYRKCHWLRFFFFSCLHWEKLIKTIRGSSWFGAVAPNWGKTRQI